MSDEIRLGMYRGTIEDRYIGRPLEVVDTLYNKLEALPLNPIASIDQLVADQINKAQRQKRTSITVLDFGSGEGQLLRDILVFPEQMPAIVAALKKIRRLGVNDFKINLIGLTDTQGLSNPPSIEGTTYQAVRDSRFDFYPTQAINYAYAITDAQSLNRFLEQNYIGQLDLVIATQVMMYLKPKLFERTLTDIADVLSSGGRCIVSGYKHFAGKRLSASNPNDQYDIPVEILLNAGIKKREKMRGRRGADSNGLYNRLLHRWDYLSQYVERAYNYLVEENNPNNSELWRYSQIIIRKLRQFRDGSSSPTLDSLLDYDLVFLIAALNEIKISYVKRYKDRAVDNFASLHPELEVIRGESYLLSITKRE